MKMWREYCFISQFSNPVWKNFFKKEEGVIIKTMIRDKKISHDIFCLLKNLEKELRRNPDIIFAYLFGSYGKGRIHPLSDVDIAVYLKESIDFLRKKIRNSG